MTTDELMALLDKATAGEWELGGPSGLTGVCLVGDFDNRKIGTVLVDRLKRGNDAAHGETEPDPEGQANAAAICAAVNYLRSDEYRRVREDAARYRWLRKHDNAELLAEDVIDEAIDAAREGEA